MAVPFRFVENEYRISMDENEYRIFEKSSLCVLWFHGSSIGFHHDGVDQE